MKTELDPKLAWGAIALLVIAVALGYYLFFRTPSGELSAKDAGAGPPVLPVQIQPLPGENDPLPPSGQPQSSPSNP